MYNLKTVVHHLKGHLDGDYTRVTLEMDGEILREFGDAYHDKGMDKAFGYIQAFYDLFGTAEVNHKTEYVDDDEVDGLAI